MPAVKRAAQNSFSQSVIVPSPLNKAKTEGKTDHLHSILFRHLSAFLFICLRAIEAARLHVLMQPGKTMLQNDYSAGPRSGRSRGDASIKMKRH
jgi:hypothetical protein